MVISALGKKKNPEFPCCKYLLFDTEGVQILPLRRCRFCNCISRPLNSCQEIKKIPQGSSTEKGPARKPPRSPHSLSAPSRFSTHLAGLFRFWGLQRQQITNNHILTQSKKSSSSRLDTAVEAESSSLGEVDSRTSNSV